MQEKSPARCFGGDRTKSRVKQVSDYTKRRPARKQKSAKSAPIASRREPLAVCNGQRLLGTLLEDEKSGLVLAWDAAHKRLGRFRDQKEAADAISDAARAADERKAASAEALEWLNRPHPEFKSGWPEW